MKTKLQILVAGMLLATVGAGLGQPATFTKVTGQAIAEDHGVSVGGSWADYDGDGYPDCYVVNLSGGVNSLYRNNHDGTFTKILTNALLNLPSGWSAVWGDYDNDGDPDIFVPADGATKDNLMRNEGGGVFLKMPPYPGGPTDDTQQTMGASWADVDRDGWLDLFVGCYGSQNDRLYRNLGNGTFRRLTAAEAGDAVVDGADTSVGSWADYDNDGYPDLFVQFYEANTGSGGHLLYHNDGTGRLLSVPAAAFPRLSGSYRLAVWGDYDNDGYLDLFEAGYNNVRSALYHNNGNGTFTNLAVSAGFGSPLASAVSAAWGDYDNDGDLDLFVTTYNGRNALYQNQGDGTFQAIDVESPLVDGTKRVDVGWVDYDRDGFLDLFIGCQESVNGLYHNDLKAAGNTNHWLEVQLQGTAANASAIGAKIRIKAVIRAAEVWQLRQVESSFLTHDLVVHFGLGDATRVDLVRIEWPSGNVQELTSQPADRLVKVTEQVLITPVRPSASIGGSVTLLSQRGGTRQWYHDGVLLEGQTGQTLNLSNIKVADGGRYSVVTSSGGNFYTNFVYLVVDTQFTKVNDGPLVTDVGTCAGCAVGDYNADGYDDLFVTRWNRGLTSLYRNNRDGTFTWVPTLPSQSAVDRWWPCAWGDFDNDGWLDLLSTRDSNTGYLYWNNRNGTFSSTAFGSLSAWNVAVADYDRDGRLDLYFSFGIGGQNWLYRNTGSRTFTRMSASEVGPIASISTHGGATWADYDDDGWPDLCAPNLPGQIYMYHNDGNGSFTAVTNLVTQQTGPALTCTWGDFNNDGRLDVLVVNLGATSKSFLNLGNGVFQAGPLSFTGNYNTTSWADYDNDGFLDLFVSSHGSSPNALYHNDSDGSFSKVATGSMVTELPLGTPTVGSYLGNWFDYDNDGFLDLYVVNGDDNSSADTKNFLYHNNGNSNAWLKVKLIGTTSNRDAVGAKVRAYANYAGAYRWQRRDINGGDAINGAQRYGYAHFGLGDATIVRTLKIEWPSGVVEQFANVAPRQLLTMVEPSLNGHMGADGTFHVLMTMSTNRPYQLQASANLVNWTTITNCTGSGSCEPIEYVDPEAPATHGARFYRMR